MSGLTAWQKRRGVLAPKPEKKPAKRKSDTSEKKDK